MPHLMAESVRSLADRVRRGDAQAEAVVHEAAEAHEARDGWLNAYVEWDGAQALEQARAVDRAVTRGEDPGPLAGIPVSVKDLYGVEGYSTRAGTPKALPTKWEDEGFLVQRLKALGAVIMGKTHTVELAFGGVGVNPHWGTPRNPWDASTHRAPGGSSSGAGVSLWEGSALVAVGSDTGGSIRIPASVTGTVGHRQTAGRWPTTGVVPLSTTLDTVGFLTRTVDDTAYAFGVIDPSVESRAQQDTALLNLDRLRVGVLRSSVWDRTAPDVRERVEAAIEEMRQAGASIREVPGSLFDDATDLYLKGGIVPAECMAFIERELADWMELLDPRVARRLENAHDLPATAYIDTLARRAQMQRVANTLFDEVDLLVTPAVPITPPSLKELEDLDFYMDTNRAMLSATCPVSLLDLCAISIPVALDTSGMPVGVQLIASHGRDSHLLAWAATVERVLGNASDRLGSPPDSPTG